MLRALLCVCLFLSTDAALAAPDKTQVETFRTALKEMREADWSDALRIAESAGPVARDVVEWHRLRAGRGDFEATLRFLERNGDWPGLKLLRRRQEQNLPFGARPEDVVSFFATQPPQTGGGSLALVEAYRTLGQDADAEAQAVLAWISQTMSPADEDAFLRRYRAELAEHHTERLDMLLWQGETDAAERMYRYVPEGWRALARARLALRGDKQGVDGLIEAIPDELQDDPGLAFERMQWRARKGRNAGAIELMVERDGTEADLGRPSSWAGWRRSLARAEMRAGRTDTAYKLASQHGLEEGSSYADLEWLAGYIALTYRDRPETALRHFRNFRAAVFTPISLGRAGYWEGRAFDAMDDAENAQLAYAFGGEYQTSFYGLLAAERAGLRMNPYLTGEEVFPDWRTRAFRESSVFEAGEWFIAAGERNLAERFLTHLTESLVREDIGSLGTYVIEMGEPHIAVMIGKRAAQRTIVVPAAYYPIVDLGVEDPDVPLELALSIARRESEFDPVVMSGAGARGLMQLMPGTARDVSRELGLSYSRARLTTDPTYNATLGTAYLETLLRQFDGNMVMVAAGYNAGPGRPFQWMDSRGDPRAGDVDVIDWIEHIPFNETRNYVMRVTESLPVYRARLSGRVQPMDFAAELVRTGQLGPLRPKPRPGAPVTD